MNVKMERTENEEVVYNFIGMNYEQQYFLKSCISTELIKLKEEIEFYEKFIEKHKDGDKEEILITGCTRGNELRSCEIFLKDDKRLLIQIEDMANKTKEMYV